MRGDEETRCERREAGMTDRRTRRTRMKREIKHEKDEEREAILKRENYEREAA